MKKLFTIALTLTLLIALASVAFAETSSSSELEEYQQETLDLKQEWLDELVEDGVITQAEADEFINDMEERFESDICDGSGLGYGNGLFSGMGRGNSTSQGRGVGRGAGCCGYLDQD